MFHYFPINFQTSTLFPPYPPLQCWIWAKTWPSNTVEGVRGRGAKKRYNVQNSIYLWPGLSMLWNRKKFLRKVPKFSKKLAKTLWDCSSMLLHATLATILFVLIWKFKNRARAASFSCSAKNSNFFEKNMEKNSRKAVAAGQGLEKSDTFLDKRSPYSKIVRKWIKLVDICYVQKA